VLGAGWSSTEVDIAARARTTLDDEWLAAHSDDRDHLFRRIATTCSD